MSNKTDKVVLEAKSITKRFPGVIANDQVNLRLHQGEILALLGENGAGKSTLMNMLYGLYRPDEGEIEVNGKRVAFSGPKDAISAGIGMVHQHFQLVPVMTVAENVMLGSEVIKGAGGRLDIETAVEQVYALSQKYNLQVDPRAVIEDLPVGTQQRVEIIKALYRKAEILILDEPTAVLTPQEAEELFQIMNNLTAQGVSIIFITHKLKEVLHIADRVAVLRRGKTVGETTTKGATQTSLAEMMVGRKVLLRVEKDAPKVGNPILEVQDLVVHDSRGQRMVDGLNLTVHAGEIVGIAGVQGNGQRELVEALTGMLPTQAGHIVLDGTAITPEKRVGGEDSARSRNLLDYVVGGVVKLIGDKQYAHLTPRQVTELGVAHIPEDREKHGVVMPYSIADNMVLNQYHKRPFSRGLLLNQEAINQQGAKLVEAYDVRTPSPLTAVGTLSGGNKQKVIVAREFSRPVKLLIASQPTRGIDVGSIEFIHKQLVAQRDEGVAVLVVSAELDEVLSLADRVAVIFDGKIVQVLPSAEATRERVGLLMAGSTEA